MKQVTDLAAIEKVVDEIIADEPRQGGAGEGEARRWSAGSSAR